MRASSLPAGSERKRASIQERLKDMGGRVNPDNVWGWCLSPDLFGSVGANINDFEPENWTYFLDNAGSLEDLLNGLYELSPLADDALDLALTMSPLDFSTFRLLLAHERRQKDYGNFGYTRMPNRFYPLLLPAHFIRGFELRETFKVPLGAAIIRLLEMEAGIMEIS